MLKVSSQASFGLPTSGMTKQKNPPNVLLGTWPKVISEAGKQIAKVCVQCL